ncbi:hypothetical protein QJS66_12335 [Kocuria rhizophila]|nr:hypothetical protein QJS66_12335 [Kocuria rhizophila]
MQRLNSGNQSPQGSADRRPAPSTRTGTPTCRNSSPRPRSCRACTTRTPSCACPAAPPTRTSRWATSSSRPAQPGLAVARWPGFDAPPWTGSFFKGTGKRSIVVVSAWATPTPAQRNPRFAVEASPRRSETPRRCRTRRSGPQWSAPPARSPSTPGCPQRRRAPRPCGHAVPGDRSGLPVDPCRLCAHPVVSRGRAWRGPAARRQAATSRASSVDSTSAAEPLRRSSLRAPHLFPRGCEDTSTARASSEVGGVAAHQTRPCSSGPRPAWRWCGRRGSPRSSSFAPRRAQHGQQANLLAGDLPGASMLLRRNTPWHSTSRRRAALEQLGAVDISGGWRGGCCRCLRILGPRPPRIAVGRAHQSATVPRRSPEQASGGPPGRPRTTSGGRGCLPVPPRPSHHR